MPRHNRRTVASFLKGPGPGPAHVALFQRPLSERASYVVALKSLAQEVLGARLRELTSLKGGYCYDPVSLFLVHMLGYLQGQRSSRRLEDVFFLVCQEAERRGVLERKAMAVDGTKVAAVRTQWRKALDEAEATDA